MLLLFRQLFASVPKPNTSYAGKTVIVTGSNVGLGLEAARHFTSLGASTVILAVRSISKGNAAKEDIETSTGVKNVVQVWHLDMSSYQSVIDFAARAEKELARLDTVVLNAGIGPMKWEVFEQDESTLTVNVVSTFLLALALLPKLKSTATTFSTRPNLTVVGSEMHFFARFPEKNAPEGQIFKTLNVENQDMRERYNLSKLLVMLFVRAMVDQKAVSQMPVTINCVCPGFCHSEIAREVTGPSKIVMIAMKAIFARSTEAGGRTLFYAASQGSETHGKFLINCRVSDPSPFVLSPEGGVVQKRVWNELVTKVEAIKPGITSDLKG
ncbi:NAD(P)-binding protein [Aaosphaeria arxii CBS 175.79]|uniref:NAD(P)-binding protein n=1 Tax=Aaosphaeria arxii CBS 175.79 TaxID=1450172 RepID=A0A6A5Y8W9_9PLEO|nr:NAD(P)-binding protein [Aaosphaeria arxii CBS 175.79]KAF2022025.1 NAD(P)-binding protein [Aaosphaeria arxii CBS 175.79]